MNRGPWATRKNFPQPTVEEDSPFTVRNSLLQQAYVPVVGGGGSELEGAASPDAQAVPKKALTLQQFSTEQCLDKFLNGLAQELAMLSGKTNSIFASRASDPVVAFKNATDILTGTQDAILDIQARANRQVDFLREELTEQRKSFNEVLAEVDAGMEAAVDDFRTIDTASSALVAEATTTGTRLSASHKITVAARKTLSLLQHVWDFSLVSADDMSEGLRCLVGKVERVFTDDKSFSAAADLVQDMLPVARDLHNSNRRLGLVGEDLDLAPPGTIEAALRNLFKYRELLENRLVQRFMQASSLEPRDLDHMAQCCTDLAHFGAEGAAVKGYIATMPAFSTGASVFVSHPWGEPPVNVDARLNSVKQALVGLLEVIKREHSLFAQVFQKPQEAMSTLVVRITEEKAMPITGAILNRPPVSPVEAADRDLALAEAYISMLQPMCNVLDSFCTATGKLVPAASTAQASLDGLRASVQAVQPLAEQMWLAIQWQRQQEYRRLHGPEESEGSTPNQAGTPTKGSGTPTRAGTPKGGGTPTHPDAGGRFKGISAFGQIRASMAAMRARMGGAAEDDTDLVATVEPSEVALYCTWHKEVIQRTVKLFSPPVAAAHIAIFFHVKATSLPPCCLLDQTITHSLAGISAASRRCVASLKQPFTVGGGAGDPSGRARPTAAMAAEAAAAYMDTAATDVFRTAAAMGKLVDTVQRHYRSAVADHVATKPSAAAECQSALQQFTQVLEKAVKDMLEQCLDSLDTQVARVLQAEQRKSDFQGAEMNMGQLDQPSTACMIVVALLKCVEESCRERLHSSAVLSFLGEVGLQLHTSIMDHMTRFKYSMFGALQWKRDMAEYQSLTSNFGVSKVNELFEEALQLANVLMVPPESLVDMVEHTLQMDRTQALKFIALREDYLTAKVDGKPLSVALGDSAASATAAGASRRPGAGFGARGWINRLGE